jgi:uncharacterized membrane protein
MSNENVVDTVDGLSDGKSRGGVLPTVVYILYLVAAFSGIPWFVGLILAYIAKGEADDVAATHFQYQIRTFWIGLLYAIIGGLTLAFGIGFLICLFTWIWAIVRSVKGLSWYNDGLEVPNPKAWLW